MNHAHVLLQVDGTPGIRGRGMAGLGLVVRDGAGAVLLWRCARAPAHTNNEAEYQAVIAGLHLVKQHYPGCAVHCVTDSQIVVAQLCGMAAVRAPALQPLHAEVLALAQQIGQVTWAFVPREVNRLADALAWEALDGRGWFLRAAETTQR